MGEKKRTRAESQSALIPFYDRSILPSYYLSRAIFVTDFILLNIVFKHHYQRRQHSPAIEGVNMELLNAMSTFFSEARLTPNTSELNVTTPLYNHRTYMNDNTIGVLLRFRV